MAETPRLQPLSKLAFTPQEVAKILSLHENTVWRYLRAGKIRAVRLGRRWTIPAKSLEKFLDGEGEGVAE